MRRAEAFPGAEPEQFGAAPGFGRPARSRVSADRHGPESRQTGTAPIDVVRGLPAAGTSNLIYR
ncbi:hypothetical protein ACIRU3_09925 [Streptomyces sp. NPDC101151]|uniref:hypothetical protein n=1 Tax=Streptomyces sp. NPDC101151 TaxID=3366115 RepID=UPI00380CF40D